MKIAVKICGLRSLSAVDAALQAGTDYVGFVFYPPSPRNISLEEAISLKRALPASIKTVAVTVNPANNLLEDLIQCLKPDYIQLHGKESPDRLRELKTLHPTQKFIKALSIATESDILDAESYIMLADMLLFDAKPQVHHALPGGNGISFNWQLLKHERFGFLNEIPWMLSGGLTAENVQEAIACSGATIVDVSSGVESAPGVKDNQKIKDFVKAAKKILTL